MQKKSETVELKKNIFKIRDDLIIKEQIIKGEKRFVVKDPVGQKFYTFGEFEHIVINLLNGERNLGEIKELLEKKYDFEISVEELFDFVNQLGSMPLIEPRASDLEFPWVKDKVCRSAIKELKRKRGEITRKAIKYLKSKSPAKAFELAGETSSEEGAEIIKSLRDSYIKAVVKATKKKTPLFFKILYFRFRLINPNKLFDKIINSVSFFFTPTFVFLASILIIFSIFIIATNLNEFALYIQRIFTVQGVIVFWIIGLMILALHECAHGLTCKYFGGDVPEIGFLLLFFNPCMYCNVSDAWLFEEKRKRLWVSFAGAFFQFFLMAVAIIIWRLAAPETTISYIAFVVIFITAIASFLNFNPLLKFDGYYILSDYLDIPNLRERSFRYLFGKIRGIISGKKKRTRRFQEERKRHIHIMRSLGWHTHGFCSATLAR